MGYLTNEQIAKIIDEEIEAANNKYYYSDVAEALREVYVKLINANQNADAIALNIVKRIGPDKIVQCTKELRTVTGLGLREAKHAVERAHVVYYREKLWDAKSRVYCHGDEHPVNPS